MVRVVVDEDLDGVTDSAMICTCDAAGNVASFGWNFDLDGVAGASVSWTYDAERNDLTYGYYDTSANTPSWEHVYSYDADGTDDFFATRTYDAAGNELTYEYEDGAGRDVRYSDYSCC